MSAHDPRSSLMGLGVFLLPLLLVKGTAVMVGDPPQGASGAGGGGLGDGIIEMYTPEWTLEQIDAAHRVEELRDQAFGESPLLHARKANEIIPVVIDVRPVKIEPPQVAVQMILRSRRGNVALIDRNRYRTGDPLGEDGWIVEVIDADTRSVLVVHPESGMEAILTVPMPR